MKTSDQEQGRTVVIVDDNIAIRELLRKILRLGGYSVVAEAANGIDAVDRYKQFRPELTIMDVVMPHKDGFDAIRDILAINRNAKVVMCTSMDYQGIALAAEGAGACGIILKPFSYEQVHEIIHAVMCRT